MQYIQISRSICFYGNMFSMKCYFVLILIELLFIAEYVDAITCSEILHQVIPGTTIYYANETTDLGSSTREEAYCQVKGAVAYGGNSKLKKNDSVHFELWLPSVEQFNGRFMVVGECSNEISRSFLSSC